MNRENKNIDDMMFDSLENFEATPSLELKAKIVKSMFFRNLFRYHFGALTAGFSGVTAITALFIYLNVSSGSITKTVSQKESANNINSTNNITPNDVQKTETSQNSTEIKNIESKLNLNTNTSPNLNANNLNGINNSGNIIQDAITKENADKLTGNKLNENYNSAQKLNQNKVINHENAATKNNQIAQNNVVSKNENPQKNSVEIVTKSNQNKIVAENKNISQNPAVINTSKNIEPINSENKFINEKLTKPNENIIENGNSELNSQIINQSVLALSLDHLLSKTPKLPIDSLKNPYDTVYNFKGEPLVLQSKFYSVDVFWSGFLHQSNFTNVSSEAINFSDQRKKSVTPVNGYESYGANFNMNYKHILLQAGLSYTKIKDDFSYEKLLLNPKQKFITSENNNPYNYFNNGNYFLIDTPGGYWQYTYILDSMIHVKDSTWANIIDTNKVNRFDSTLKTIYDTLKNQKLLNTYSYFEIPIMLGYEMCFKNFDFAVKGGIITSFLTSTTGNNTTHNTSELAPIGAYIPFRKIFFSGIISVSANYRLTDCWGIYAEPYYRQGLTNILSKNTVLNQQMRAYGVRFGIRYKF